jgi:hypothetical protein
MIRLHASSLPTPVGTCFPVLSLEGHLQSHLESMTYGFLWNTLPLSSEILGTALVPLHLTALVCSSVGIRVPEVVPRPLYRLAVWVLTAKFSLLCSSELSWLELPDQEVPGDSACDNTQLTRVQAESECTSASPRGPGCKAGLQQSHVLAQKPHLAQLASTSPSPPPPLPELLVQGQVQALPLGN